MSLPLLAAPLRLAVVLVLFAWLAPLPLPTDGTPDPPWLASTAWAILALTLVVTACRLGSANGRWRRLAEGAAPAAGVAGAHRGLGPRTSTVLRGRCPGVRRARAGLGRPARDQLGVWPAEAVDRVTVFRWALPTSVAVLAVVAVTQGAVQWARRAPAPAHRRRANPAWVAVSLGVAVIAVAPLHELTLAGRGRGRGARHRRSRRPQRW